MTKPIELGPIRIRREGNEMVGHVRGKSYRVAILTGGEWRQSTRARLDLAAEAAILWPKAWMPLSIGALAVALLTADSVKSVIGGLSIVGLVGACLVGARIWFICRRLQQLLDAALGSR